MPMVSITMVNCGWPRIGRMATRSSSTPNAAIAPIASTAATKNGSCATSISARPAKAPSIISSPCAKLTVSVAL
jgi:hypothetical protein